MPPLPDQIQQRAGTSPAADSHLLGTIVCLAGHHTAGVNQLELVDGQQRLTTISILLHCLLDRLKSETPSCAKT